MEKQPVSGKNSVIEQLLETKSHRELQEKPSNWTINITLPEAQKITKHLLSIKPADKKFRLGIIHTYTSDLLNPWLEFHSAIQEINLETYHAPYGMNIMESQSGSGLLEYEPDLTLFMLQREDLHPKLKRPISGLDTTAQENLLQESTQHLLNILMQFRAALKGRIVITILPSRFSPELGLYDAQNGHSECAWWASFKKTLTKNIDSQLESAIFVDLDALLSEIGRNSFFDSRYWYTSRFPFTPRAANEFSRKLIDLAKVSLGPIAKVIVLDADNTLWGGVIGEEGINGIALGPDYPGNAFMDFQRRILDYKERGFILALCSKNNHQDVIDVLQQHPHQILRESHFSAFRINWQPKYENIISLAEELNLGLDSFIFVDDSDYECGIVRQELPQVQVIQTPQKPIEIPFCLEQISRLEILNLTQEDKNKTQLYEQERQRRNLQKQVDINGVGIIEYLASLQMEMTIEFNSTIQTNRLAQLSQKTNQFNLTTRRYTEQQIQELIASNDWLVASFSLADKFGNSGIVGLALVHHQTSSLADIDTFLMSCRVIGRQAESAFLEAILRHLENTGISDVHSEYIPTLKNQLVADFYLSHQFSHYKNNCFTRSLLESPPLPENAYPIKVITP